MANDTLAVHCNEQQSRDHDDLIELLIDHRYKWCGRVRYNRHQAAPAIICTVLSKRHEGFAGVATTKETITPSGYHNKYSSEE